MRLSLWNVHLFLPSFITAIYVSRMKPLRAGGMSVMFVGMVFLVCNRCLDGAGGIKVCRETLRWSTLLDSVVPFDSKCDLVSGLAVKYCITYTCLLAAAVKSLEF